MALNIQPGDKILYKNPDPVKKEATIKVVSTKNVVDRLAGSLHRPGIKYVPMNVARRKIGPFLAKELGLSKKK